MDNYVVKIEKLYKELSVKEKILVKDFGGAVSIDEATRNTPELIINVVNYAICNVHNERSSGEKDYQKIVVIDTDGKRYVTGSKAFLSSLEQIADEYANEGIDEAIAIKVYRRKSKNYNGDFITCSAI